MGWVMFEPMRALMRCFSGPCRFLEKKLPGLFGGVLRPAVRAEEIAAAAADTIEAQSRLVCIASTPTPSLATASDSFVQSCNFPQVFQECWSGTGAAGRAHSLQGLAAW